MNLPNRITLARIFLIPIVMIFLLVEIDFGQIELAGQATSVREIIAALVFIIAAATDGLDGYIARKRKLITNLGKFLDPLADKLLVTAALISLVEMQRLDAWIAIIIISREFAVSGLRMIAAAEGTVIAASKWGKLKTVVQIIMVVDLMINNLPFNIIYLPVDFVFVWLAVIITIVSGIDYFIKNKHVIQLT